MLLFRGSMCASYPPEHPAVMAATGFGLRIFVLVQFFSCNLIQQNFPILGVGFSDFSMCFSFEPCCWWMTGFSVTKRGHVPRSTCLTSSYRGCVARLPLWAYSQNCSIFSQDVGRCALQAARWSPLFLMVVFVLRDVRWTLRTQGVWDTVKLLSGFLAYCAKWVLVSKQALEQGDVPILWKKKLLDTQSQAQGHTVSCGVGI